MTIVAAKTNKYGPATLDLQVEQGTDFVLGLTLEKDPGTGLVPWDLTNAIFDAHLSSEWSPGQQCVPFTVNAINLVLGKIQLILPAATTELPPFVSLPHPPRKSVTPEKYQLGGWVLDITDAGVKTRYVSGKVYMDRNPCLT
jgi:hypothetical protein